jgi:hypothetical protein
VTVNKPAFTNGMDTTICAIRDAEVMVARIMRELGPSEALDRFVSRYAKVRTPQLRHAEPSNSTGKVVSCSRE